MFGRKYTSNKNHCVSCFQVNKKMQCMKQYIFYKYSLIDLIYFIRRQAIKKYLTHFCNSNKLKKLKFR